MTENYFVRIFVIIKRYSKPVK